MRASFVISSSSTGKRPVLGFSALRRCAGRLLLFLWAASAVFLVTAMSAANATAQTPDIIILALGDSLTAGYGLGPGKSYPTLLEQRFRAEGYDVLVHNAGVSGDVTSGGLARLDWTLAGLPRVPDLCIVELGANDALRGLEPARAEANLDAILTRLDKDGITTLLAGMYAPFNMGPTYASKFNAIYPRLADRHGVALYPFFLEGVAGNPDLNQPDGIHPTAEGTAIIVDRLYPVVKELVDRVLDARS